MHIMHISHIMHIVHIVHIVPIVPIAAYCCLSDIFAILSIFCILLQNGSKFIHRQPETLGYRSTSVFCSVLKEYKSLRTWNTMCEVECMEETVFCRSCIFYAFFANYAYKALS
jgi:hypothetical protein